jgi:cobyrinic acid a,c-diamide synthase
MVGALAATARMTPKLTLAYPLATSATDSLLTRAGEVVTGHEFHRTHVDPPAGSSPAWTIDDRTIGFVSPTLHASYLHVHWAGHPHLAQRFADAAHATAPHVFSSSGFETIGDAPCSTTERIREPLRHHGDAEADPGLLDFAVNVYAGSRPRWLDQALRASLDDVGTYPSATEAEAALARHHDRPVEEVLATAGAAEAFSLVARARPWRLPVVVHPQFTEPHAALEQAGHDVTSLICDPDKGFALDPATVPDDSDLVIIGNPTNPTGVLHPAADLRRLLRPGRLLVVDEAFMDTVPGGLETLTGDRDPGLLVVRSLTKHWSVPGVRAGYLLTAPDVVAELRRGQVPWSVSTTAAAAIRACSTPAAAAEAARRADIIVSWRHVLIDGLEALGLRHVPSSSSFVLVQLGIGAHEALRRAGIAVRRADTFPGLDASWVRIAVRPPEQTAQLLLALNSPPDSLSSAPSHALG